mgnify:CR=1 FL=1
MVRGCWIGPKAGREGLPFIRPFGRMNGGRILAVRPSRHGRYDVVVMTWSLFWFRGVSQPEGHQARPDRLVYIVL